jgi:hypothetical protein
MRDWMRGLPFILYEIVGWSTFVFLTFFDGYKYNYWNWAIAIPINLFLSQIWPIYWTILHWIF